MSDKGNLDDRSPAPSESGGGPGPGKVFVGGITPDTNEQDLKTYFSDFGEVIDIVVMRDKQTGHGRGFGFVTFADKKVADRVLDSKHEIKGRSVEAKSAVPRSQQEKEQARSDPVDSQKINKIFVGGLAPAVTDADFKEYFEQYGPIQESIVMTDKETNRSRGFGFITFTSHHPVDEIMKRKDHTLKEKMVEVKKAFRCVCVRACMRAWLPARMFEGAWSAACSRRRASGAVCVPYSDGLRAQEP
eukprot:CAMPEP_0206281342 /NCGR_PEP_ID=MMETSP0047_2-20121206/39078_1 /ASSEMBLY_ACC=CAM_ASM_000192 /TAXON_ID=195065 /ORGANISM="Chroomonas mesostigmatica_cf, Strain CCMP1168" /LENGTH=244 /DNA_ID=CAMNT_0053711499 /DNA_START=15 /DNA_END=746 /DNA_ORIENTATION=+